LATFFNGHAACLSAQATVGVLRRHEETPWGLHLPRLVAGKAVRSLAIRLRNTQPWRRNGDSLKQERKPNIAVSRVQMTKAHRTKVAVKQASKPRLSASPKEPEMAHEHASIDSLDVMKEVTKFLLRRAIEASDEEVAKRFARDANRAFTELARYHPLYNRLWRKGFDMRDLRQAKALLEALAAIAA
jgi:hypothetical protein